VIEPTVDRQKSRRLIGKRADGLSQQEPTVDPNMDHHWINIVGPARTNDRELAQQTTARSEIWNSPKWELSTGKLNISFHISLIAFVF
jgi:hypothetical protein